MPTRTKIAIIGVGLLGGSLALALKKRKGIELVGWNHRVSSRKKAAKIIKVAGSFEKAVAGADIVVLCAHSSFVTPVLQQLTALVHAGTLIMDVSSVKGEMARGVAQIPGMALHFVPCHPMAGKEKSGPTYADESLYRGKSVFVTPLPKNPKSLVRRAAQFWKKVGAFPVVVDPHTHDRAVALTSHLPHLLASAMIELYDHYTRKSSLYKRAVGSGFRDFTRIAAGNPTMWGDIVEMNANEIKSFLSQYRRQLERLERNLKKGRGSYWHSFFEKARVLRKKLK